MTTIIDTRQYSWPLWFSTILLLLIAANNFICTGAVPLPDTFPAEYYDEAMNNYPQHRRVGGERKMIEAQLEMQPIFEARARQQYIISYQPIQPEYPYGVSDEMLPIPSAQHAPDKRQNYMTLCHFKLCNMGRKRPL